MPYRIISAEALLICLFLLPRTALADSGLESTGCVYDADKLYLKVRASTEGTLTVQYKSPPPAKGSASAKLETKRFDVSPGDNTFALSEATEADRILKVTFGASTATLFANRGSWFVGPSGLNTKVSYPSAEIIDSSELSLTESDFSATFGAAAAPTRATVGRSLGVDGGDGLKVDKRYRFIDFDAHGTVGPVKVTVTERLDDNRLQYWDYSMMIDQNPRRFAVPFEKLIPRSTTNKPLSGIHSIAWQTVRPVREGDTIAVSRLTLAEGGPYVTSINGASKGAVSVTLGGRRIDGISLHFRDPQGVESSLPVRAKTISVPDAAREIWFCYPSNSKRVSSGTSAPEIAPLVCDPPDAPFTTYSVPPRDGSPLRIDRFDREVPVNAFRLKAALFGSSETVEQRLDAEHRDGALSIVYYPESEEDYAGIYTDLPERYAAPYKTLSISLKGSIPLNFISAGIKDRSGREARIPFISYRLGDETPANPFYDWTGMNTHDAADDEGFTTAAFPIDAFRAAFYNLFEGHAELKDISGISVTMYYGGPNVFHEMELKRASLTRDIVPISITAFDGDLYGINALGGVNFDEAGNGGEIDVRLNADGYYGKGLKVTVKLPQPESYGLVAFGFGRLDISDYRNLTFYVRGQFGDENDAFVYLNDGGHRSKVPLKQYTKVTRMWRKVTIPLNDFKKMGVNLSLLSQLILAWEDQFLSKQTIYFDNFMFE